MFCKLKGFTSPKKNKKRLTEEEDMAKRFLVLIALLMLGFFIAGCAEGDKSATVTNPNPDVFAPTGSISGVVFNPCTNTPVKGAVVSLSYAGKVHQVTTAANGAYGFNDIPANAWDNDEDSFSVDNGYVITCDLTKVTGYGYAVLSDEVYVYYSDLADGSNYALGEDSGQTEGGSGASTPVNHLAESYTFEVAPLTSSISGTIYDVTTGLEGTAATVQLFLNGSFVASTTASAAGAFSFANVMPAEGYILAGDGISASSMNYTLMVTKTGYDIDGGEKVIDLDGYGYGGYCGFLGITCPVPCNGALTDVQVFLVYNPERDMTSPYITSVIVPGGTAAANGGSIYGDVVDYGATEVTPFATLVLNFSEAMNKYATTRNACRLTSSYTVTLTSAGTGGQSHDITDTDIIKSWVVAWNTAGTALTFTPTIKTGDELKVGTAYAAWGTGVTATFVDGYMEIRLSAGDSGMHLTDLAGNFWRNEEAGSVGEDFQDYFIFPYWATDDGDHYYFWIGQGTVKADFDWR
jgi:hypothetical protein